MSPAVVIGLRVWGLPHAVPRTITASGLMLRYRPHGAFSWAQVVQKRCLADERSVRNRMRSIQSIQKITKAMKMVASAKLRMDQTRRELGLPFCAPVLHLMNRVALPLDHVSDPRVVFLIVSTDKGLCGGVNSAVARLARQEIQQEEASGWNVSIFGIGDKIRAALQRKYRDRFHHMVTQATKYPLSFSVAAVIAHRVLEEKFTRVSILHNAFRSVISFDTNRLNLLTPVLAKNIPLRELDGFDFEPERALMWQDLLEFYTAVAIYQCLLEGAAAEQSARMAAMDGASKNAGEMLSALTLSYNKARQLKITMELIEIIAGANAL